MQGVYKGTPTRCFDCHWERRQDDRFRLQLGLPVRTVPPADVVDRRPLGSRLDDGHAPQRRSPADLLSVVPREQRRAPRSSHHVRVVPPAGLPVRRGTRITSPPASRPRARRVTGRATSASRAADLNHNAIFPLVGQHAQQACAACHVNNVYKGTSRDCVGCHRTAYDRTTAPNHVAAGFSDDV